MTSRHAIKLGSPWYAINTIHSSIFFQRIQLELTALVEYSKIPNKVLSLYWILLSFRVGRFMSSHSCESCWNIVFRANFAVRKIFIFSFIEVWLMEQMVVFISSCEFNYTIWSQYSLLAGLTADYQNLN